MSIVTKLIEGLTNGLSFLQNKFQKPPIRYSTVFGPQAQRERSDNYNQICFFGTARKNIDRKSMEKFIISKSCQGPESPCISVEKKYNGVNCMIFCKRIPSEDPDILLYEAYAAEGKRGIWKFIRNTDIWLETVLALVGKFKFSFPREKMEECFGSALEHVYVQAELTIGKNSSHTEVCDAISKLNAPGVPDSAKMEILAKMQLVYFGFGSFKPKSGFSNPKLVAAPLKFVNSVLSNWHGTDCEYPDNYRMMCKFKVATVDRVFFEPGLASFQTAPIKELWESFCERCIPVPTDRASIAANEGVIIKVCYGHPSNAIENVDGKRKREDFKAKFVYRKEIALLPGAGLREKPCIIELHDPVILRGLECNQPIPSSMPKGISVCVPRPGHPDLSVSVCTFMFDEIQCPDNWKLPVQGKEFPANERNTIITGSSKWNAGEAYLFQVGNCQLIAPERKELRDGDWHFKFQYTSATFTISIPSKEVGNHAILARMVPQEFRMYGQFNQIIESHGKVELDTFTYAGMFLPSQYYHTLDKMQALLNQDMDTANAWKIKCLMHAPALDPCWKSMADLYNSDGLTQNMILFLQKNTTNPLNSTGAIKWIKLMPFYESYARAILEHLGVARRCKTKRSDPQDVDDPLKRQRILPMEAILHTDTATPAVDVRETSSFQTLSEPSLAGNTLVCDSTETKQECILLPSLATPAVSSQVKPAIAKQLPDQPKITPRIQEMIKQMNENARKSMDEFLRINSSTSTPRPEVQATMQGKSTIRPSTATIAVSTPVKPAIAKQLPDQPKITPAIQEMIKLMNESLRKSMEEFLQTKKPPPQ